MPTTHADSAPADASRPPARWQDQPWVWVLAGGVIMGLALGVRHAGGMFQLPMTLDHQWSREVFGFAIAVQNLVWGLAQPFTGMLADRFGARRVIVPGLLLYALGLAGMRLAATPLELTLSAGLCIGIALSGTSFGVVYGALSRMVAPSRRGWALGVAGALGGLGQFAMVPLVQGLIDQLSWSGALLALALCCALALPLAWPLRDALPDDGPRTGPAHSLRAALREAFQHRGFWLLSLGFFACGFQLAFIALHLPAYLLGKGLSGNAAVVGLALIALSNVLGTYCCGWLGGMFRRTYLLAAIYVLRAGVMALFFMLPLSHTSLYLFCLAMGFVWLGTVPLTNGVIAQIFGVKYLTTLFGFVFFGHQLGAFFGVWLGGYLYDTTRSYDLVWLVGIGLGGVAALLHWPINDQPASRPATLSLRPCTSTK